MSYAALKERMEVIRKLISAAEVAKRLPDDRRKIATMCRLGYGNQDDAIRNAFAEVCRRFADEEHHHGEIARDRELKRLAVELDKARRDLAELAQSASFDLLDTCREWRS